MAEILNWFFDNLNYWTVTLLMTIEGSAIPMPSEFVVPPAAYNAASGDGMNIYLVVLFSTIGATLGSVINYVVAFYLGRPIIYAFANSKLGKLCMLSEEKIKQSEEFFVKYGAISTFIGRLIPVVRQLISIPAGLSRMPFLKFLFFTALGAGIWNIVLAALGYYLHSIIPKEQLMTALVGYSQEIKIIFGGAGLLLIIAVIIKFKLKKKK